LPLLRPLTRQLSDRTITRVRADFPGWDIYVLKQDYDRWLNDHPTREPTDYEAAFYGFVRKPHTSEMSVQFASLARTTVSRNE
jgi:hypothetical protein